jgi:uncharacterized membrane protein
MALSADGKVLATGSGGKTAMLWDLARGKQIRTFSGHSGYVVLVALSGDGKLLLTASERTATLWEAATGKKLQIFQTHTQDIAGVALSADGKWVATSAANEKGDKKAILWDAATGKPLRTFDGHAEFVLRVALSGDGKYLVTGSLDKMAILWEAATGQRLRTFAGHTSGLASVALSADGRLLATGSFDKTAVLWEAARGKRLQTFEGHTAPVLSVALSADGKQVLTGSEDQTAILWDAASGKKLHTFQDHRGAIVGVALSADGKQAWTSSQFLGTTRLWDAATGKELGAVLSLGGTEWLVSSPDLYFDGSAGAWKHVEFRVAGGTAIWDDGDGSLKKKYHRPGLLKSLVNGSIWEARDLKATFSDRIKDSSGEFQTAEKGTILELTGTFTASDLKKASADLPSVVLAVVRGGKNSAEAKLLGVALFRKPENRLYHLPKQIVKGIVTEKASDVGGFKLSREKEGGPMTLTLLETPTQLCLAFEVPRDADATYEVRFGDLKASVPAPGSK